MTDRGFAVPRICPSCDGVASVAITSGGRDRHGHLRTITVDCKDCHGVGALFDRPPTFATAGR
ncbi:hypothetical protein [Streptomyces kanamyceticus]|uniref:Uncharacterized protein n=1 Tax=Streptomyces kanamyceticus TaxID=1967 RepID=A0A5J6GG51_STRKN|nr:hypothetical protein [Streptomyces kanamyceticus]QEU93987.1 hypothetical protein CP970_26540 [Streptomyces kanamyceticus]